MLKNYLSYRWKDILLRNHILKSPCISNKIQDNYQIKAKRSFINTFFIVKFRIIWEMNCIKPKMVAAALNVKAVLWRSESERSGTGRGCPCPAPPAQGGERRPSLVLTSHTLDRDVWLNVWKMHMLRPKLSSDDIRRWSLWEVVRLCSQEWD